ncbi:MAG: hypothetical protein FWF35_04930 [Elusimicrobia bacterium]|nr:hypothetical protein [Elusimicrobiota bacterium]
MKKYIVFAAAAILTLPAFAQNDSIMKEYPVQQPLKQRNYEDPKEQPVYTADQDTISSKVADQSKKEQFQNQLSAEIKNGAVKNVSGNIPDMSGVKTPPPFASAALKDVKGLLAAFPEDSNKNFMPFDSFAKALNNPKENNIGKLGETMFDSLNSWLGTDVKEKKQPVKVCTANEIVQAWRPLIEASADGQIKIENENTFKFFWRNSSDMFSKAYTICSNLEQKYEETKNADAVYANYMRTNDKSKAMMNRNMNLAFVALVMQNSK